MPDHNDTDDDAEQFHYRRDLRPGDIVHDLGQKGWPKMRLEERVADTLTDYAEARGTDMREFEANALTNARAGDSIWLATYLTDSPHKSADTHYPVPSSRIAKQDLDHTTHVGGDGPDTRHPAGQAVGDFLTDLLTELKTTVSADYADDVRMAASEVLDDDELVDLADDLSQTRMREQSYPDDEQDKLPENDAVEDDDADQDRPDNDPGEFNGGN